MSTYQKKRTQIRLNAIVAVMLLGTASFLAIVYGSAYFAAMWVTENQTIGVAVMGIALFVAAVCVIFLLKIMMKLRAKLAEVEKNAPMVAVSA